MLKVIGINSIYNGIKLKKQNLAASKPLHNTNNASLSAIYYQPVFQRKWKEHTSWGLELRQDGSSSAKLFTYPDAQAVSLSVNENTNHALLLPLSAKGAGVFGAEFEKGLIKEGDKYQFVITKADGTVEKLKDPYTFYQTDILGASEVYDQSRYVWHDKNWFSPNNPNKISRKAGQNNSYKPLSSASIYELNIASLTQKGDFRAAKEELKRIKDTGFSAIEIMPVENTYSYNWGYDGVDKFAPASHLGHPDELKELIDEAHKIGLNVIMDMVPNHIGPDGAQLHRTGPYIGGSTDWGDAFNYEGKDSRYVRDYMVNVALNWLHNYHCDGLRLDMTSHMNSDTTMQQIAAEVNYHFPDAFLIAEDGRNHKTVHGDMYWDDFWQPHDQRVINSLLKSDSAEGYGEDSHDLCIEKISQGRVPLARLGYDSEWDFYFYHTLTNLAYGDRNLAALERAVVDSANRVKYLASHDEIGNNDGTRIIAKYMVHALKINDHIYLDDDDLKRAQEYVQLKRDKGENISYDKAIGTIKAQKSQQSAMKLAKMVQDGRIESFIKNEDSNYGFYRTLEKEKLGLSASSDITPQKVFDAFKFASRQYRALAALMYFTPGPVMTFQGEENLDMSYFRFFREFCSIKDEHYLYVEKGYPNGISAFLDSKMGAKTYPKEARDRMNQFQSLISDLNKFKDEIPAASVGKIVMQDTVSHPQNPTIAFHAKDDKTGSETFAILNLSKEDYPVYNIEFPKGKWVEYINTNDTKYGGEGSCINNHPVLGSGVGADGKINSTISLPAMSSVIFKKI